MIRAPVSTALQALALLAVVAGLGAVIVGEQLRYVELRQPLWLFAGLAPMLAPFARSLMEARPPSLRMARTRTLSRLGRGAAGRLAGFPDALRIAAGVLLAVALARPQSARLLDSVEHEGIDIAMVLDMSESMEIQDLTPNRLEAAKLVLDDFIQRRRKDRIALVAFGATASTVSPLTLDHDVLRALVRRMRLRVIDGTRTAIGAGLGVALNRLDESEAESRVIVLLTDGVHNAGGVDPDTVAQEAAKRDVRIYTVLVGQHEAGGGAGGVDPAQLERIAGVTGGYAYTAVDRDALTSSFQDLLDKLERSAIESSSVRSELFQWLLFPALLFLLLDLVLRNTRLRRFP